MADGSVTIEAEITKEQLKKGLKSLKDDLDKLKNEFINISGKMAKGFEAIGTASTKAGDALTLGLTTPLAILGTKIVSIGNDFEAQMSRVQGISGATGKELEKLTDQAIELGSKTSFSASESAVAMENLASAGFEVNEIMEAMPGLLDLAASSGAELGIAAEIAASAVRAFGLEASDTGHVADVLAEAAARTNAQTEDMGYALKYVAPVANSLGLTIEETAAAIGIMSDAGIKGEQAGTTLRGALVRLVKPTKPIMELMEELGLEFYNAEGKMKSLTEITQILSEKTKNLSDEERNNAYAVLFGTESLSGMLALADAGSDKINDLTKAFEECDGSAAEMAETMLDNTKGAIEEMNGSLETAFIKIQRTLAPTIKKFADYVGNLADKFSALDENTQETIVKFTGIVMAAGPVLSIFGRLTTGIGKGITAISTLTQAIGFIGKTSTTEFGKATKGVQGLTKVLQILINPATLAVIAITAVSGAVAYFALKESDAEKAAREFAEQMKAQKDSLDEYCEGIDKTTQANLSHIDSVDYLRNELKTLVDENGKVKEGYETRVQFILEQLNNALGTEYELNEKIIGNYKDMQKEIDNLIEKKRAEIILSGDEAKYKNAKENEKQAVEDLAVAYKNLEDIQKEYGMTLEELKNEAKSLYDLANNQWVNGGSKLVKEMYEKQANAIQNVIDAYDDAEYRVKTYTEEVKGYETNYALFLEGKYNEISNTIINATKNWTDASLENIQNSIAEERKNLEVYANIYETTGNEIAKQQKEQTKKNLQALTDELVARTSTIDMFSGEEITAWGRLGTGSYNAFSKPISRMPSEIQSKIQETSQVVNSDTSIENSTKGLAQNAERGFKNGTNPTKWGIDLISLLVKGLTGSNAHSLITKAVSKVAGWIDSYLGFSVPDKGPLSDMDKSMPDMIDLMSKGIDENKKKLIISTKNLATEMNKNLADKLQNAVSLGTQRISTTLSAEAVLRTNKDQARTINNNNGTTINNTQNFYEKNATPYEEQKQARQQLRRLAYEL